MKFEKKIKNYGIRIIIEKKKIEFSIIEWKEEKKDKPVKKKRRKPKFPYDSNYMNFKNSCS